MFQQIAQASGKISAKDRLKFNIFEQLAFYHQRGGIFREKGQNTATYTFENTAVVV